MHRRYFVLAAFFLFFAAAARAESAPAGERLYETKCVKCHKLYDPAGYSDEAWGRWMTKMRKKAHLNDEQAEAIRDYTDGLRRAGKGR